MKYWKQILFVIFALMFLQQKSLAQLPHPDHIVIVIEENHGYTQIIGSSAAPYINSLVNDTLSALFTDSHGVTHPSQPNYLWLFSGDNQGVIDDNIPADTPFVTPNLGKELLDNGLTFAGYSESLPYTGFTGSTSGTYARKHNPWVNWQDANPNGIPWNLNEPFTNFPTDYNTLPAISFVIPNQNDDMHNGSDPATITTGDTWLQNHLNNYIQWAKTHNSLMIVTFDEDDFTTANLIPTIFVGEMVKDGDYNQSINHLNVLKTLEDMYGLNYAGSSGDSTDITGCWNEPTPVELTSFSANIDGKNIILNWTTATETNNKGFEIERQVGSLQSHVGNRWINLGFVQGYGTSENRHSYSFSDKNVSSDSYLYRLKQIDFDGSYKYSNQVEVKINVPLKFSLSQNYPNPFNPSTTINYSIPSLGNSTVKFVQLKVYDILGKEIETLVNKNQPAGSYEVKFDAKELPGGVYFYRIRAGSFSSVKKMVLLR